MKKFVSAALAALVAVAFIACGGESSSGDSSVKEVDKEFPHHPLVVCDKEPQGEPNKFYDKKECDERIARFKKECDNKNGESCATLGYHYTPESYEYEPMPVEALTYHAKGCDYGSGRSCQVLAYEYEFGKKDYAKAIELNNKALGIFEKKCSDGSDYDSCLSGGSLYYDKREFHKALKMYKAYCDNKDTDKRGDYGSSWSSCVGLGEMYMKGEGTTQNFDEAKKYFKIVCDAGNQNGCDAFRNANERTKK